jgi:hypothetical protein
MGKKRISLKGKGADLFFSDYSSPEATAQRSDMILPADEGAPPVRKSDESSASSMDDAIRRPSHPLPRQPQAASRAVDDLRASKHASTLTDTIEAVEAIRKTVKRPGKEVVYVRLTPEEKAHLADVVYTYRRQGIRTSDNELGRIAINGLLADFQEHGEHSLLAQVLAALDA